MSEVPLYGPVLPSTTECLLGPNGERQLSLYFRTS